MLKIIHKWNKMLNLTHKLFKSAKIAKSKPKNTKMLNLNKWNKMHNLTHKLFKSAKIAKSKTKNAYPNRQM